jgi:hypothetical protein
VSQADRSALAEWFRLEAAGLEQIGSPFYGELERRMADDVETGGPAWTVLESRAGGSPADDALALRLLGGVHRMVLAGTAPTLARHYPSAGGDGDTAAAWLHFRDLLARPPAEVLDALTRPPQTNEVGRSASLVPGFLRVAADTGLPLRLLELGSSAGLNLRVDRYRYEQDGNAWGDPDSPVCFVDLWPGATPPLGTPATISTRAGCDRDPIDAADPESALTLLSYVWPDQAERLQRLRDALDIARDAPVDIARAPIDDWLPEQLADPVAGVATVVFHSVVWQYLPESTRALVHATLEAAGGRATATAPLAYLRLEPAPATYFPAELRITSWPGAASATDSRLLATSGFHFGPVTWL